MQFQNAGLLYSLVENYFYNVHRLFMTGFSYVMFPSCRFVRIADLEPGWWSGAGGGAVVGNIRPQGKMPLLSSALHEGKGTTTATATGSGQGKCCSEGKKRRKEKKIRTVLRHVVQNPCSIPHLL